MRGGAKIFSSFIKENLFDEIFLFEEFFYGDGGLNAVNSEKNNFYQEKFSIRESIRFGNDSLEILDSLKKIISWIVKMFSGIIREVGEIKFFSKKKDTLGIRSRSNLVLGESTLFRCLSYSF